MLLRAVRGQVGLAAAIAADAGLPVDDPVCQTLAHFALDAVTLVRGREDTEAALDRVFALLENGWTGTTKEYEGRGGA